MTRTQIETALAAHNLWAAMRNGRYWLVRRNGQTQTWKTRPSEFRIPVKAGLKAYGEIRETSDVRSVADPTWRQASLVIAPNGVDPNKVKEVTA